MRIQTSRNDLLKPVQTVIGSVDRKATLPILQNILVDATRGYNVVFTATDIETMTKYSANKLNTDISVSEPGCWAIPAKRLSDILRALPEDATIKLEVGEDGKAILRSGRSRFVLPSLPGNEYPVIEELDQDATTIKVKSNVLHESMIRTSYAMAKNDVRYYLNGMLFDWDSSINEKLKVIATDGHRLALHEFAAEFPDGGSGQIILPTKSVFMLTKMIDDVDSEVTLQMGRNHLFVETGDVQFISKLLIGKFPDFQRVIPRDTPKVAVLNREELNQLLRRVALVLNDKSNGVRFVLGGAILKVFASNTDQEEGEDEMEVNYTGDNHETGLNSSYFQSAIQAIDGELIKISMSDPMAPMRLENAEGDGGVHVVMPMRL